MDIQTIIDDPSVRVGFSVVVGFTAGVATGYYFGKKSKGVIVEPEPDVQTVILDAGYISPEPIILSEDEYAALQEPEQFVEVVEGESEEIIVIGESLEVVEEEVVVRNVFATSDNWDYEKELASRDPEKPYIIHQDEFFANEKDFDQLTITYYQADDILVDEKDSPVHNYKKIVGELKFGHGASSESVVYVRNEQLGSEYEVILSESAYMVEVLGHSADIELDREQSRTGVRKFREE